MRRISIVLLAIAVVILPAALAWAQEDASEAPEAPEGMVLIPGGSFLMGDPDMDEDNPEHEISVDAFYMDTHEVTNARYREFCDVTGRALPVFWGIEKFRCGDPWPDHPVVGVSWIDATAYAEWAGKRLPTEAEWEYAARGGLEGKKYSFGDVMDSTLVNGGPVNRQTTTPVGSFPPNGFGLYDTTGNVREWVQDRYDGEYYFDSPKRNPPGPSTGRFRVLRGGGWHTGPYCCRVARRAALASNWGDYNVGFRCARDQGR